MFLQIQITLTVMEVDITMAHRRGWNSLPRELQDMILECSTWQTHDEAGPLAGTDQLAALTTVCRDWQAFFESKLFRRLTLKTEADIQAFAELVQGRRRAHVEWIWLRIELPMYDCQQCHLLESCEDVRVQKSLFTNLVWDLFDVLSSWKIKDARSRGITLELSAHSPSDVHHFNKDLRFRLHDTAWDRWDDRPVSPHNDPFHGWQDGRRVKTIPKTAKLRMFGFGLRFDYASPAVRRRRMRLPKVSVVTSLAVRRQFPRAFAARNSLDPMLRSLTRLGSLAYEPWRGPTDAYQNAHDRNHALLAAESLRSRRKTLKKVSIFESHDDVLYRGPHSDVSRRRNARLFARCLARASHHLEELCVANNIDAFEFFYAFRPGAPPGERRWMAWGDLTTLSLTTQHLVPGPRANDVVLMAAGAAGGMPRLRVMELWNRWARGRVACIFRFRRGQSEAGIELVSTWPARFTEGARAAWAGVAAAAAQRPLPLRVEERRLDAAAAEGQFSVLRHLELVGHMLHPVSLRQIAREDQRRREERVA